MDNLFAGVTWFDFFFYLMQWN